MKTRPTYRPFSTVLIANRGEIACRIIRTARNMGLQTIAVFSEADAGALHVKMADQAFPIGPSETEKSYLNIKNILKAAKESGAQAIHPGYGFLSENAEFARACLKAGLVFIGPAPEALSLMGDKAKAKRRMIKAGVPCIDGYQGKTQDDKTLINEAGKIGFPVMVKAAAGGGGRGMRLVRSAKDLPGSLSSARSEAKAAFGSDTLIIEKALIDPRHVEIQIFADSFGHTLHLGERDCSVQRRHQKVLEEAPCPVMTTELREKMGASAVKAAMDIGYVGAGTVEFMLDENGAYYFLEMNTRLQVEHPVTEMVTGLDLVALHFRTAQGQPLELSQKDIKLDGHAIEARLYAEDPARNFLPSTGRVELWGAEQGGNIRIDSGIETGGDISPFYDPMIAKIIAKGETREAARLHLIDALKDLQLFGVTSNRDFLIRALDHEDFIQGQASTSFIEKNFPPEHLSRPPLEYRTTSMAALLQFETARDRAMQKGLDIACTLINWHSASPLATPYIFADETDPLALTLTPLSENTYRAEFAGVKAADPIDLKLLFRTQNRALIDIDGRRYKLGYHIKDIAHIDLSLDGVSFSLTNKVAQFAVSGVKVGVGYITAPMHGAIRNVFVKAGDHVETGDRLAVLEAMKMQHDVLAQIGGIVDKVHIKEGEQVSADSLIIEIKPTPEKSETQKDKT